MFRRLVSLGSRLRALFRRDRAAQELDDELRYHIERQAEQYRARGLSPGEARQAALREFGRVTQIQEECRDARRVGLMENFVRDLRFSARNLMKAPVLVLTAGISLSLGIGGTTVVYSLFQELVLTPPTAREPHRLIDFRMGTGSRVSFPEYRDLSESQALDGIAGYSMGRQMNLRADDDTFAAYPLFVTANFFEVLGLRPAQGRLFAAGDASADVDPQLAVVSHGFWQTRLAGDPDVVGRVLLVNGVPHTIHGVLPREVRSIFGYGTAPEIYLPLSRLLFPDLDRRSGFLALIGRLKPGMSVEEAQAALTVAGTRLEAGYPIESKGFGRVRRVLRLDDPARLTDFPIVPAFLLLFAVVGVVFLIACANLAGVLLARGTARYRETAIRAALGADRARLVQHFLMEGFLLACFGTLLALGLNVLLTEILNRATLPTPIPVLLQIQPDAGLLAAGFVLTLFTTLLGGLGPAWQASRPRLSVALKQEEPATEFSRLTWRKILVGGQVAVSFILLVTAALFLRNMRLATETKPGFDVEPVSWAEIIFLPDREAAAGGAETGGGEKGKDLEAVAVELRSIPGVESAAYAGRVPLTHDAMMMHRYGPIDIPGVLSETPLLRSYNSVSPGYFQTMGIPLLEGRDFDERDRGGDVESLIVNQTFVDRYLERRSPIGQTILEEARTGKATRRIIGVAANSKYSSLGEEPGAAFYYLIPRRAAAGNFLVRANRPAETMVAAIGQTLRKYDPLAAVNVRTMRQGLTFAFLPSQMGMLILGSFGLVGLFLAMIGLYGMLAYSVSRRTSEIGIRMALGATHSEVVRMALRESLAVVGVGAVAGLGISLVLTRLLARFLVPALSPNDPLSLLATLVCLTAAALVASWLPARRAARIDPMAALRHE
ncbi:MAG: ABC transporter permease [Bryobacterales bacterium]